MDLPPAPPRRVKSAGPRETDLEDQAFIHEHSKVQKALQTRFTSKHPCSKQFATAREVAELSFELQRFHERLLGKNSAYPRLMVKFPNSVFRDTASGGSLFLILAAVFDFALEANWRSIKFSDDTRKLLHVTLFRKIEIILNDSFHLKPKRIHFSDSVQPPLREELTALARHHGAQVVDSLEVATHSVYYDDEVDGAPILGDDEEETDYMVPRDVRPAGPGQVGRALIHWWYYPDSYDQWIPSTEVDAADASPPNSEHKDKIWVVNCRFLKDLRKFNEWGEEEDYAKEEDAANAETDMQLEGGKKKKRPKQGGDGESGKKKKPLPPVAEAIPALDRMEVDALAPSENTLDPGRTATVSFTRAGKLESTVTEPKATNVVDYDEPNMPRPAWYNQDKVAALEVRSVPEFFDQSSPSRTPTEYKRIRDAIVSAYEQNRKVYLSATQCRTRMAGDAGAVMRVHAFLDAYRIINFEVKAHARPRSSLLYAGDHWTNPAANAGKDGGSSSGFTVSMDAVLMDAVLDNAEGDWAAIATAVGQGVTEDACIKRFAELPLLDALGGNRNPSAEMNSDVLQILTGGPVAATSSDRLEALVKAVVHGTGIGGLDRKLASNALVAAVKAVKGGGGGGNRDGSSSSSRGNGSSSGAVKMDVHGERLGEARAAALGLTLGVVMDHASKQGSKLRGDVRRGLLEYSALRLDVMEEKLKLLEAAEKSLDIEQHRIGTERRDLVVIRAQNALAVPQQPAEL